MYRIDITTDVGVFTVHQTEIKEIDKEKLDRDLEGLRVDIMAGYFFLGYPPDYSRTEEPFAISLGNAIQIKAFVVYPYKPEPVIEISEETGPVEGQVDPFTTRLEYLGNKLTITGCQMYSRGVLHVLPVKVNGEDHTAYIKQPALQQLLAAWLEGKGLPATDYLVIVPDIPMDYATTAEYLIDYVGGIAMERAGNNAKAWNGWRPRTED